MASLIIISWRDIPSQVVVKRGRETAKVMLSDAYIAEWQRSAPTPCGEDLQAEAAAAAQAIEARYSDEDLDKLIRAKGLAATTPPPAASPDAGV